MITSTYESEYGANSGSPWLPDRIGQYLSDVTPLQHNGLYATVWTALHNETPVVVEKYTSPGNIDDDLADWRKYSDSINNVSQVTRITTARNLDVHPADNDVYFIDEHAGGPDVSAILSDETVELDDRYKLAVTLLGALTSIPRDGDGKLSYMIDGKISNFCVNPQGGFTYVDTFPAFIRQQDSGLLKPQSEHINEIRNLQFDSFITGDVHGVVGKYIGTLKREHPEIYTLLQSRWGNDVDIPEITGSIQEYIAFLLEDNNRFIEALYVYNRDDRETTNRLLQLTTH